MEVELYVGNLSYTTTEDELRTLFAKAGTVASVAVKKDRSTGDARGFAFVTMASQAEAQKAISKFDGLYWNNRELKVSLARPRENQAGGFGQRSWGKRY
jgi:RNA recognition motif-containing protein